VKIRAREELRHTFIAGGEVLYVMAGYGESSNARDVIRWNQGDLFCLPGGGETRHVAKNRDCLPFAATDESLLAFAGLRAPERGHAGIETTYWSAAGINREFEVVWARGINTETAGSAVLFTSQQLAPSYMATPTINVATNTLPAGADQRPHRHYDAAITLALQGEGVCSMIDEKRVEWSTAATQITPATALHSHHNHGPKRMHSLVIQDEGLHHYSRITGFSFG